MTFNRDAPNLQGEALDGFLRMQRPARNSHRIVIEDIGNWKVDVSYQRRYLSAEHQRQDAAPLGAVRAQLQMGRLITQRHPILQEEARGRSLGKWWKSRPHIRPGQS